MSTRQVDHRTEVDPIQQEASALRPYPPSFVDGLMKAVKQLPIPYGLTYLVLFVLESLILHVSSWVDGWLAAYAFSPVLLLFPVWLWLPLAIMTYLNSTALEALSSFSPLLDMQPEAMQQRKYEFTTLPVRGAVISSILWAVVYLVFTYLAFRPVFLAYFGAGTLAAVAITCAGLVSYAVGSAIYYHSFRQLRLVHETVRMVKQFDLFRLDPVYAFSRLTSRTGMAWVLLLSATLLIFPIQIALVQTLMMLTLQILLAVAAFALPLWIVNQRLVAEKRRLLAGHDQRVKATLVRLHQSLDDNEVGQAEQANSALSGLAAERDILARIPTWPWRTGLLTGFLSVIALPIILFIIQLLITKWLGP